MVALWKKLRSQEVLEAGIGGAVLCVVGDRVLLVGGLMHSFPQIVIVTYQWRGDGGVIVDLTQSGDIPRGRIGHSAVVSPQGKVIVFGGISTGEYSILEGIYEGELQNVSRLAWRLIPETICLEGELEGNAIMSPRPRAFHGSCGALVNGKWVLLIHGGVGSDNVVLEDLWCFDPTPDGQWEVLKPQGQGPGPISFHSATSLRGGNTVAILGGGAIEGNVYILDLEELTWSSMVIDGLEASHLHTSISVEGLHAELMDTTNLDPKEGGENTKLLWGSIPIDEKGEGAPGKSGEHGEGQDGEEDNSERFTESILIFGGVGGGTAKQDAVLLCASGKAIPLAYGAGSQSPEARYNHAMAVVGNGRAVLIGGCRGDGARLGDIFELDLTASAPSIPVPGEGEIDEVPEEEVSLKPRTKEYGSGDVYVGGMDAEGMREGHGRCDFAGGGHYEGEWSNDLPHGSGKRTYYPSDTGAGIFPLVQYTGEWVRGVREGCGVGEYLSSPTGGGGDKRKRRGTGAVSSFSGEWVDGKPHGSGSLRHPSGELMEGTWEEGNLAWGTEREVDGGLYEGHFQRWKREGQGRLVFANGSEYEGAWKNGRRNGIGSFQSGVSREVYKGKWVGDVRCGKGTCEYASGTRYQGLWLDGLRHGAGVQTDSTGTRREGYWHKDKPVDEAPELVASCMGTCDRGSVRSTV